MQNKIKIVLTGGGTAGHVLPHFALFSFYKEKNWDVCYIGTSGIEQKLIEDANIPFFSIKAGKLRRHLSFQNFLDLFFVLIGIIQSFFILWKEKPHLVFTKGGYVSVPVSVAAWFLRIPVITHESDLTPGLANKIIANFSSKILCAFPGTLKYLPKEKAVCVGLPIRQDLKQGLASEGYRITGFNSESKQPIILIMGGSQGALRINQLIDSASFELLKRYRLIHITGTGKQTSIKDQSYFQIEYVSDELKHLLAITDLVVCRAGANSIFEMLALKKPMLLIPLEAATRGDQILNAEEFRQKNWALVLREKSMDQSLLLKSLSELESHASLMKKAMAEFPSENSAQSIFSILESVVFN